MMQSRVLPLLVAAALQILPMCRVVTLQVLPGASGPASIVMRWVVGVAALMGAVHAVSGASTVITSPKTATGTNGVPFSYRITTGPEVANTYKAAPLPPGLVVSTTSGKITGTPTAAGLWSVLLTASDSGKPDRTVTATLALTILAPVAPSPPAITTQPQSKTVTAGSNVTFSVVATGTAPLAYQWRLAGTNLAGKTAATLALSSVTALQAGTYSVVVTNPAGSITSSPAILTVNPAPVPPSITTQPQSQSVLAGATASFSVAATGTAPLAYQWRKGTSVLAGQTGASLTLAGVATNQAGQYSVIVSNQAGTATSQAATLTVTAAPVAPTIVTQPLSRTVTEGGSVTFSVVVSGTTPLVYQWRFGTSDLPGQTGASLILNNVNTNQAGEYSVTVTNGVGGVASLPATLTVTPAPIAPSIVSQPQSQTVSEGAGVTFSVEAAGTAPFSYQWRFGNTPLSGKTASSLMLNSLTTSQSGDYSVVIGNAAGSITSQVAVLTVNALPVAPSITTQPANKSVSAGSSVSFSVMARGTGPLAYQWWFGGTEVPGQTSAVLLLSNVQTNQAGTYAVVISNAVGAVTSAPARLDVILPNNRPPAASWAAQAGKYNGLLHDPNGVALGSSGFFAFSLSSRGTYTASVLLSGGWRLAASGSLAPDGRATNTVVRPGSTPATVVWALDMNGLDRIEGTVSTDIWLADLSGDRAIFNVKTNPCPFAGRYTCILPGTPGATDSPAGDSYGSVMVDTKGFAMLKGMLADGSKVVQKVPLSRDGQWPLFVPLYGRTGALLSWLQFENRLQDDLHGAVSWIKPFTPAAVFFPQGFSLRTDLTGSVYVAPPKGVAVVQLQAGAATITGGSLSQTYTVPVQIGIDNKVTGAGVEEIHAGFVPSTGVFAGTFKTSGAFSATNFKGVVLQKMGIATGYFLGGVQSGRIAFE